MRGKTNSGFEYSVNDHLADDYEFLEKLKEASGNDLVYLDAIEYALGTEQKDALKEHCRIDGYVSSKRMNEEFIEILKASRKLKK